MLGRLKDFHVAVDRWVRANPWRWSASAGILMFFIGWLTVGRTFDRAGSGEAALAGAIWGAAAFIVNAVRYCPGPGHHFENWRPLKTH
jgi:hypothetical protein